MTRWSFGTAVLLVAASIAHGGHQEKKPPTADEVHLVCIYEGYTKTGDMIHGGKAKVTVDRKGKTVVLVLSASDSVTWDVTVAPGTTVKQVVLAGNHRQAAKVPAGVEVVEMFREGRDRKESIHAEHRIDSARFRQTVQDINELTGLPVSSFQGASRATSDIPFVVDSVQKDPRLDPDFPKVTPIKDLPDFKTHSVRLLTGDNVGLVGTYGEFTREGPVEDSFKYLAPGIRQVAFDPDAKKHYGVTVHDVNELDLKKTNATKLDTGLDVPRVNSVRALTFDTKRKRLLLVARSNYLYEFVPGTGAWRVLAELPRVIIVGAMVHYPPTDDLFILGSVHAGEGNELPQLFRLTNQGVIVDSTELGAPMFPGLLAHPWVFSHVQLSVAGDQLAAVILSLGREGSSRSRPESFLYLIDPKTKAVKLAWKKKE